MRVFVVTAVLALTAFSSSAFAERCPAVLGIFPTGWDIFGCLRATDYSYDLIEPVAMPTGEQIKAICTTCPKLISGIKTQPTLPDCTAVIDGVQTPIASVLIEIATNCGSTSTPSATTPRATTSTSKPTRTGFNGILLVPIILGVLVVVGVVFWLCRRKKRQEDDTKDTEADSNVQYGRLVTPAKIDIREDLSRTETGTNSSAGVANRHPPPGGEDSTGGVASVTQILLNDPNLMGKRLAFDRLQFDELVSNGGYGEVWICRYEDQVVAVKRLLQKKHRSPEHIDDFAQEIRLSASLHHPNIVRFLGVAWDSVDTLSMVLEYLPCGDLQTYLRSQGDLLSWPREKIRMAHGMASALVYMHARTPVLIHRDLKSRNVLLSDNLETKIIDFGVSTGKRDETMTAGVGTPFWTAPEVLEGTRYSEKSDIYSFGVMLTELDTCKMPYHDAIRADGEKLLQFQILNNVLMRDLRPSCTPDCPARVRRAVDVCLQQDPAKRPTALELLQILEGQ